jgi:Cys-rich repeat protein
MRLANVLRNVLFLLTAAGGLIAVVGPGCGSGTVWGGSGCNDVCPGAEFCDTALGCVECRGNGDCGAGQPFCVLGRCRQCEITADCGAGQACYPRDHQCHPFCDANGDCADVNNSPFCDLETGACVGCVADSDCGDQPFCNPTTGQCAECIGDADCGVSSPFCDPSNGECHSCIVDEHCGPNQACDDHSCHLAGPCTASSQCPGDSLCNLDNGECVECLINGDCGGGDQPFCSLPLGECVECLVDADCPTGELCQVDGQCNN